MSDPGWRIAINAGGGDAPGLNAVIEAAAHAAYARGWELIGLMVAVNPPRIDYVPSKQAIARMKSVPLDGEGVLTARSLGIALGD